MSLVANIALKTKRGAVLVMVLVVIVSLSLAIALATRIISQRLSTALDSKDNIENIMQSRAKLAELTYLISTQRVTVAGVSQGIKPTGGGSNFDISPIGDELRTDGFVYEQNGLRFSIQNQAGLISINSPEQFWLQRYLNEQGLNRLAVQTLLDSLADFADENDSRRGAGAESFAYNSAMAQASAVRLPRNYLLQSCAELFLIKGWNEREALIKQVLPICSTGRRAMLNINSMPEPLLKTLFKQSAVQIWQNREMGQWLVTENNLANTIPSISNFDPNTYSVLGGRRYEINAGKTALLKRHVTIYQGALPPFKVN
jgi:general secretion pathway protein K